MGLAAFLLRAVNFLLGAWTSWRWCKSFHRSAFNFVFAADFRRSCAAGRGGDSSGDQGDSTGPGVLAHRGLLFDVPVPQVVEYILEVIKVIPQEWESERIEGRLSMCPFRMSWRRSLKLCDFSWSASIIAPLRRSGCSGTTLGANFVVIKVILQERVLKRIVEKIVAAVPQIWRKLWW